MTLRAAFIIFGLLTCMPSLGFLVLFQPPKSKLHGIALSLRLLTFALALSGLRVVMTSIFSIDRPVMFANLYDKAFAITTLALGAAASVAFLAVYLNERIWPEQ